MKKILLLHSKRDDAIAGVFEDSAKQFGNILKEDGMEVYSSSLDMLVFDVSRESATIRDSVSGLDIEAFDLVAQRRVHGLKDEAHAVAVYCEAKGRRYIDSYLNRMTDDKMSSAFMYWADGRLNFPRTLYGKSEFLGEKLAELGGIAVLKSTHGAKGQHNYVVHSADELRELVERNSEVSFILQEYIPNDGDYRVLVLNYKPVMVIKRVASEGTHLNNTSMGGSAENVSLSDIPAEWLDMAVAASRVEKLEVAGVDIIVDRESGEAYVLEVNQSPQISTGTFVEEKERVYTNMLADLCKE